MKDCELWALGRCPQSEHICKNILPELWWCSIKHKHGVLIDGANQHISGEKNITLNSFQLYARDYVQEWKLWQRNLNKKSYCRGSHKTPLSGGKKPMVFFGCLKRSTYCVLDNLLGEICKWLLFANCIAAYIIDS